MIANAKMNLTYGTNLPINYSNEYISVYKLVHTNGWKIR